MATARRLRAVDVVGGERTNGHVGACYKTEDPSGFFSFPLLLYSFMQY